MRNEEVMPLKMAKETIEKWLDSKRISEKDRTTQEGTIENLVEAVRYGNLVLNEEDFSLTQSLVFPLGTHEEVSQLTYKNRIADRDIEPYRKLVKGDDINGILTRTILALTDKPVNVIRGLDKSTDRQLADSIAIFFV